MALERGQRPRLVVPHEAAIADHVGGENSGKFSFQDQSPSIRRLTIAKGRIQLTTLALELAA